MAFVGVLISKRLEINIVQYPRIPSRIFNCVSHEEVASYVIAKVVMYRTVDHEAMRIC
jgi:hypothetical protein